MYDTVHSSGAVRIDRLPIRIWIQERLVGKAAGVSNIFCTIGGPNGNSA